MLFNNIKAKLFLVLVVVSIVPIIVVSVSSYRSYTRLVNEQTSLVASTTIQDSVKDIEAILQNIDRITITLLQQSSNATAYRTVNDELRFLSQTTNQHEIFMTRARLKLIFENLLLGYNYINGIYLFTPNGNWISYSNGTDLRLDYEPMQDVWYRETLERKGDLYIGEVGTKPYIIGAKPSISFSRALYDPNSYEFLGVFMIDCSMDMFGMLQRSVATDRSNLYLAGSDGDIIYDSGRSDYSQGGGRLPDALLPRLATLGEQQEEWMADGYLTVMQRIPYHDWQIIARLAVDELHRAYGISEKLFIYVAASVAAIFLLLSFFLSNIITKPVIQLARLMRKSKTDGFVPVRHEVKQVDEIGILYHEFHKLMDHLDTHIRESYQNRILTMDAQMKAMEAQINSHFLYNTLESINSIAEIEEVESIVVMTKALGDMFRYSIKTDSELVPAREELQHVDNYMAIQQIRYGDKIGFVKTIAPEVESAHILKLMLQPLVENAIYHGLESKRGGGTITLRGRSEAGMIRFEIEDDGVGMSEEQLGQLHALLAAPPEFKAIGKRSGGSIGIKNVHSRITLYYGPSYGLTIDSSPGRGTRITVTIPAQHDYKEE